MEKRRYNVPATCRKCGGDNWYFPPSGSRVCRTCHTARRHRLNVRKKVQELPNKIADMQAQLDKLRTEYSADPKNHRLAEQYGIAERRFRWESTREQREQKNVTARAERLAANEEYRNRPRWDDRDWIEHLPAHCPACGGLGTGGRIEEPLRCYGYSIRVGEYGAQCTICRYQWKLEQA